MAMAMAVATGATLQADFEGHLKVKCTPEGGGVSETLLALW
jgi:hypothetical protein